MPLDNDASNISDPSLSGALENLAQEASDLVSGKVSGVLASEFITTLSRTHRGILFAEDGIYLTIDTTTSATLIPLLDKIIQNGFYFRNFNATAIQQFTEDPAVLQTSERLRLGDELLSFSEQAEAWSRGILWEKEEVFYVPDSSIEPPELHEFLGMLWRKQIRFGILRLDVEWMLGTWKTSAKKTRIATPLLPIDGQDAKRIDMIAIEPKYSIKASNDREKVDMTMYECVFPQTPPGNGLRILIEKLPKKPGKDGLSVTGERIPGRELMDIDLRALAWVGTVITIQNEHECIATEQNGFLSVDPKTQRISVTKEAIGHKTIGPKTGSLEILSVEEFHQQASIAKWYRLLCKGVVVSAWEIEGKITSIEWDVVSEASVNHGEIYAEKGNIGISHAKVVNGSRLEAYEGKISLKYAENSIIIGHEVEIERAANCIVVGDVIRIAESHGTSCFGKSINIGVMTFPVKRNRNFKIIAYIHDDLLTRKRIKARMGYKGKMLANVEILQSEIVKLEHDISRDDYKKAFTALSEKPQRTEAESKVLEKLRGMQIRLTSYIHQLEEQKNSILSIEEDLEKDRWRIEDLHTEFQSSIGVQIESIRYSEDAKNAIQEQTSKGEPNISAIARDLPINIFAYHAYDIPKSIGDIPRSGIISKEWFYQLILQLMTDRISNDIGLKPIYSPDVLDSPCVLDYAKIRESVSDDSLLGKSPVEAVENMRDRRTENRLLITSESEVLASMKDSNLMRQKFYIPVRIDEHYKGYMSDITSKGVSVIIDPNQKYLPAFEVPEKIFIEFLFEKELIKTSLVVTNSIITPNGLLKIGGYYVNLGIEWREQKMSVLKMRIEAKITGMRIVLKGR